MIHRWYQLSHSTSFKNNRTQRHQAQQIKKKPPSACWNCDGRAFRSKVVHSRHTVVTSVKGNDIKRGFHTQQVHNKHRQQRKTHTNRLMATFLPNTKANRKYVSVNLNGHCLRHNPHLTETKKNGRLVSTNTYKIFSAECIWENYSHHWRIANNNRNWGHNSIRKDLHGRFET